MTRFRSLFPRTALAILFAAVSCALAPGDGAASNANLACGRSAGAVVPADGPKVGTPLLANEGGLPSSVVVDGLDGHPTDLAFGPDGTLYVSVTYSPTYPIAAYSMFAGRVYAIQDGEANLLLDGLHFPTGLSFLGNDLYIATLTDIVRVEDVQGATCAAAAPVVSNLPFDESHWTNGVTSHDGRIYAATGHVYKAASTSRLDLMGSVWSFVPDGSDVRREATGLRNPYALAFDTSGRIWASDNGPNVQYDPGVTGEDGEYEDELNLIERGGDYGFHPKPMTGWADSQPLATPGATPVAACISSTTCGIPPVLTLGKHTAPTGVTWHAGRQQVFAAKSSWGQVIWYDPASRKSDVVLWNLNVPTGIELGDDGALYVCEWTANRVIRVDLAPNASTPTGSAG